MFSINMENLPRFRLKMPTDLSNTLTQPVACVRFRLNKDKLSGGENYVSRLDTCDELH